MLSGGLDSSGITALAGKEFAAENKTLHTYSVDFVNSAKDFELTFARTGLDAPWVKRVSEHVGTSHHDIIVNAEELANHLFVPSVQKIYRALAKWKLHYIYYFAK